MKMFNAKPQRTPGNDDASFSLVGTPRRGVRTARPQNSQPATCNLQPSQRGVALIVTLILLAVVTVMAVAFLALSRRERGAVTTATDTAGARLAADAALAGAEAQIMASTLATTNPYNFGLVVSTNYITAGGFQTGTSSLTNISYQYPNGNPLNAADLETNIANLLYSPRVPVYVSTNSDTTKPLDFRFYLDLNRNGRFDTNGVVTNFDDNGNNIGTISEIGDPEWIGVLDHPDQPHGPNNRFIARYAFFAVAMNGNGLDLNAIHNQTITRQVDTSPTDNELDGYMRNQGVGSWEINLAAFLADLNTNQWGQIVGSGASSPPGSAIYYQYNEPANANSGHAFEDALSLLSYRYGYNYNNLLTADNIFGNLNATAVFPNDGIDGYSDGPLQTTFNTNEDYIAGNDDPSKSWAGSDNTNQFFDLQELFNPNESSSNFTNRLLTAGSGTSTYNRYTYYRLLSQMGVDSAPAQDQMNLNYSNALASFDANGVVTNITYFPDAETNLVPWTPLQFFTIAADRMLRAYSEDWLARDPSNYVTTYDMVTNIGNVTFPTNVPVSFGITNIPVWIGASNQFVYSSAIQRVLQLAANIYDATTNVATTTTSNFPSVFRPTFNVALDQNGYTNVYINGYQQVTSVTLPGDEATGKVLATPTNVTALSLGISTNINVYGVPWIIGAKKGFPNFNEFSLESIVGVTRRLQVTRATTNAPTGSPDFANFHTNQMYTMNLTNSLGVECWNSYASNFLDSVQIVVRDNLSGALTNDDGMNPVPFNYAINNAVNPVNWPGAAPWVAGAPNTNSFDIPLLTSISIPLNSSLTTPAAWWVYRTPFAPAASLPVGYTAPCFVPDYDLNSAIQLFETNTSGFPFPHFGLLTTNRLQVFMVDTDSNGTNHVIDYAQFAGPDSSRDLNAEIVANDLTDSHGVWNTNYSTSYPTIPNGVLDQIQISRGLLTNNIAEDGIWHRDAEAVPLGGTIPQQQAFFDAFFRPGNIGKAPQLGNDPAATATNLQYSVQAPYSPTRYVVQYTTWQANDPLVHYVAGDLNYTGPTETPSLQPGTNTFDPPDLIPILPNLGKLNEHYSPWGGNPIANLNQSTPDDPNVLNAYNLAVKDPGVAFSDNWDFPTNKFPTVGWLGRLHRGTPWQTVDLKSLLPIITSPAPGVATWTNWTGDLNFFDAANSAPGQDWQLFDLFSTAFNDNATRGQLSVNVGAGDTNNALAGLAAWSALFSGVVVPTNAIGGYTVVSPAGAYNATLALTNQPPIVQIVTGINQTRTNFLNDDGLFGTYEHVGDILSVPQLTVKSPFLTGLDPNTGINDEMYEWLPQQTLSLLRVSGTPQSPMRYVIYCYGQTLKPAPNGIVTSGSAFGLCTNYQVVAEADTRAVVQINSTHADDVVYTNLNGFTVLTNLTSVTNNEAVIKEFNVLPPN